MPETGGQPSRGIALMVAAMGCFALADVLAKRLVVVGIPVHEIMWMRYVALAATIGALLASGRCVQRSSRPWLQAGRAIAIAGSAGLFIAGLSVLPVSTATAIVFSSPLFVTMLAVLVLGERVATARWVWVGVGFAGVVIVANPAMPGFHPAALLPLASAATWAVAMVMTRMLSSVDSSFTTQSYSCAIGLGSLSLLFWPLSFVVPTAWQLLEAATMGIAWALAQWLVVLAYRVAEASRIAPFAYAQLLWTNALSVVVLQQAPSLITLAGTVVIAIAGIGAARSGLVPTLQAARQR